MYLYTNYFILFFIYYNKYVELYIINNIMMIAKSIVCELDTDKI